MRSETVEKAVLIVASLATLGAILLASADKKARKLEAGPQTLEEKLKQLDQKQSCIMASEVGADLFRLLPSATRSPDACTGAVDLLSRYGLSGVYATLCNKPIPDAIENSRFFRRVVGSTAIRRGDGMELMELVESPHLGSDANLIQTFPLEMLRRAFPLRENGPVQLPEEAKGVPTVCVSAADDGKDKKSKKHRHKDKEKHRHKDKEKRRHKDKEKGKEKGKVERSAGKDSGGMAGAEDHSKKHKKRKKHETDGAAGK